MAFVIVDDTSPLFNYKDSAWSAGGITGEFQSTHHSTSTAGAQVIFGPFTGSSISVFSTVGGSQPKIHFMVDSGSQNVDTPARSGTGIQLQQQLYAASDLDPTKQHTLQINVLDAGPFTLDFVQIGTTPTGVTTTSNSLSTRTIPSTTSSSTTSSSTTSLRIPPTTTLQASHTDTTSQTPAEETSTAVPSTTPIVAPSDPSGNASTSPLGQTPGASETSQTSQSGRPGSTMSSGPSSTSPHRTSSPSVTPGAALGVGTSVDGTVIGSVTGAILFLALVVVGLVLYLRRRRFRQRRPAHTKELGANWLSSEKRRPSLPGLRLNLSGSGSSQKLVSPFLPTHRTTLSGGTNASSLQPIPTRPPRPEHSFLEQDPAESPIFDIKQRPISGATMTTRVTVGTNVSERASVPEFVYEYPFSEPARPGTVFVGPGRSAQAAPIFTLPPLKDYSSLSNTPNSVNGTMSSGHTWSDDASVGTVTRNPTVTPASTYSAIGTNLTSRPQSILEIRSAPTSANPSNQALHSFAPDEKVSGFHYATNLSTSRGQAVMAYQGTDVTSSYRPTSFDQNVEAVLHQDAGITLESSLGQRRVDLPPHYSTIGFNQ